MAVKQRIERRLARLEQRSAADAGAYVVDIGDEAGVYDRHGWRVSLDEWQRLCPDTVVIDIGGRLDEDEATHEY